jgi:hypothetical protein
MLETLITSKTRLKLLLKFFLNPESKGYLRSLESEFGESTNGIRLELNRFESAGLLVSYLEGNKKFFQADTKHPLFSLLQKIIHNYIGLDSIIENVIFKLGKVESVYLIGDFARGLDASFIDLILVGDVDQTYLSKLVKKAEVLISRKVKFIVCTKNDLDKLISLNEDRLLLWEEKV